MLRSLISRTASLVSTTCSRLLAPQPPTVQSSITPYGGLMNQIRTSLTWPTKEEFLEWRFLLNLHRRGPKKRRTRRHPTDGRPQMKGIVLKTLIKKPKKPNSANRKCVLLRLSNGRESVAYIPGIGHNLQEHSQVLVHFRRVQDVPGLRLRVIRGALDCAHVIKQTS